MAAGSPIIHAVAGLIARRIERGSAVGAWAGALLGLGCAAVAFWLMMRAEMTETPVATAIILGAPTGIVGMLVGSAVGPRRRVAEGGGRIRLTNMNAAGGALLIVVLLTGLLVACAIAMLTGWGPPAKGKATSESAEENWWIPVLFGVMTLFAWVAALRVVWWVDIGDGVSVRKLLVRHQWRRPEVTMWGFQIAGEASGVVEQRAGPEDAELSIQFSDGRRVDVTVRAADREAVVRLLSTISADDPAGATGR